MSIPTPTRGNDLHPPPRLALRAQKPKPGPGSPSAMGSPRSSAMVKLGYSVGLCRQHSATRPSPALRVWAALREAAPLPFPLHCPPPPAPAVATVKVTLIPYHLCPAPLPWEPGMTSATQSNHLSHPRLLETPPVLSIPSLGHRSTGLAARSQPRPTQVLVGGAYGKGRGWRRRGASGGPCACAV